VYLCSSGRGKMNNSISIRVLLVCAEKDVTDELVRDKLIYELSHLKNIRMVDYQIERDLQLVKFVKENNPDDSYYLPVTSVLINYEFDKNI